MGKTKIKIDSETTLIIGNVKRVISATNHVLQPAITLANEVSGKMREVMSKYDFIFSVVGVELSNFQKFAAVFQEYQNEYFSILGQYGDFFRDKGVIAPRNFYEFLSFLSDNVYPDKSLGYILSEGVKERHFGLFHEHKTKLFSGNFNNPASLSLKGFSHEFKDNLFELMLGLPVIYPTTKENLLYAIFGDELEAEYSPINICDNKRNLFYFLIYRLVGADPYKQQIPNAAIRKNVCLLFNIRNKESRMPTLSYYPKDWDIIDSIFTPKLNE